jgi:hypothetical protein
MPFKKSAWAGCESSYLDWRDLALTVGQTFTDPDAGVSVTTEWVTPTQAGVTVQFAGTGSTASSPTVVSVTTNQTSYTTGQTVANVRNRQDVERLTGRQGQRGL